MSDASYVVITAAVCSFAIWRLVLRDKVTGLRIVAAVPFVMLLASMVVAFVGGYMQADREAYCTERSVTGKGC